jgi:hypothetical protein
MMEKIYKVLILMNNIPQTLVFILHRGCSQMAKILSEYEADELDDFYVRYRSLRKRGLSTEESLEKALSGYGCHKGWSGEVVGKVTLLHKLF